MKILSTIVLLFVILIPQESMAQQGEFYFFWGWNRSWFTTSRITFQGDSYDFTLDNVIANDRQTKFDLKTYFHPGKFTIPQYNFRMGYAFAEHYDISIGIDHMKYVVENGQTANISGIIADSGTDYDGNYTNQSIIISSDFLKFEHTDGLNYVDAEIRRRDKLWSYKFLELRLVEGLGLGIMLPKTNTTLLNNERHDKVHLSGFGINTILGIQVCFGRHFFVQSEWKAGYIQMPDIRTTKFETDTASQHFYYSELDLVFGAKYNLRKQ